MALRVSTLFTIAVLAFTSIGCDWRSNVADDSVSGSGGGTTGSLETSTTSHSHPAGSAEPGSSTDAELTTETQSARTELAELMARLKSGKTDAAERKKIAERVAELQKHVAEVESHLERDHDH